MGTLYRNGIPYVGSGGAGGVEVTQAEYDALPTSEKMNGSIYFITDGSVSYPTASQMRYDNTESGIPSTSVQGAIDELKIEIGDTDISTIGDGTLSGAVSELNNGLIAEEKTLLIQTNQIQLTVQSCYKVGNIVVVSAYITVTSAITEGNWPLFKLPAISKKRLDIPAISASGNCFLYCAVNSDIVRFNSPSMPVGGWVVNFAYAVAD